MRELVLEMEVEVEGLGCTSWDRVQGGTMEGRGTEAGVTEAGAMEAGAMEGHVMEAEMGEEIDERWSVRRSEALEKRAGYERTRAHLHRLFW